jgi:hypothetical protein
MSEAFRRLQIFLYHCGFPVVLLGCDPLFVTSAQYRAHVAERFFWVCMAQRVSITAFALFTAVLHYSWNASLFPPFAGVGELTSLLIFAGYTLAVEWTGSTIVTLLIAGVYRLNVVSVGGVLLLHPSTFTLCALCAAFCLGDLFVNINSLQFGC